MAAKADLPVGPYEIHVQAKLTLNGKEFVKLANVTDIVRTSMANLGVPPREMLTSLAVGVTDRPVFSLVAKPAQPEVIRGTPLNITVTAVRGMGFTEDVALLPIGLPANVTVTVKPIGKGTNDIQVQLAAAPTAAYGPFTLNFRGTAKAAGKDFAYYAVPLHLAVVSPFDLKIEPSPISLKPGAKAKVKVTAVRKTGFTGPIDVELKNLPANVTAPKTPIPMGKNDVEIELTAAPAAAAGEKADVNAAGTCRETRPVHPTLWYVLKKSSPKKRSPRKRMNQRKRMSQRRRMSQRKKSPKRRMSQRKNDGIGWAKSKRVADGQRLGFLTAQAKTTLARSPRKPTDGRLREWHRE